MSEDIGKAVVNAVNKAASKSVGNAARDAVSKASASRSVQLLFPCDPFDKRSSRVANRRR